MAEGLNIELLKKWKVLKELNDKELKDVKFFHAFQSYTGDGAERMSSVFFVTTNDEVFVMGNNNEDNLLALSGNDFAEIREVKKPKKIAELSGKSIRKIVVSERFGAALTDDGKVLYWGTDMSSLQYEARGKKYVKLPYEPRENFKIADMACGAHSITFVTADNRVIIWGCVNLYYSEFYEFTDVRLRKKVQVKGLASGWYHAALLDQNGHVWTFGYDSVGQLGYKTASRDYLTPRKVPLENPCIKVECGAYSTLFLLKNGDVYACGSNSPSDHLCVGKTGYVISPSKVNLDDNVSDIAATYAWSSGRWQSLFSAASQDGTKYYKWGDDSKADKPKTVEGAHSLLDVFVDFKTPQSLGELVRVDVIELGRPEIKETPPKSLPNRSILSRWTIFYGIDEEFVQNIDYFTVFDNSIENEHVFGAFIKTNTDDVYSWGCNSKNAKELGLSSDELIVNLPAKVDSLSRKNIKKILFNFNGGIGLSDEGTLYVWGANSKPILENRLKGRMVTDFVCGSKFYVYLLNNSEVYLNGEIHQDFPEVSHQKIVIPGNEKAVSLSSGGFHFLVLTDASNVYAFGNGRFGQLGNSSEIGKSQFQGIKINSEPCNKIMCGTWSSFFLTNEGELYALGMNYTWHGDNWAGRGRRDVSKRSKIELNETVEDIAAAKTIGSSGDLGSAFALKTKSGKIYKLADGSVKPDLLAEAKYLVEAFEDTAIPQSLSMVHLSAARAELDDDDAINPNLITSSVIPASSEKNFFGDPLYSDVTIKLKDGVIPGHRVLLHTESSFFRNALSSNAIVDRNELDLVSYNPKAIRAMLKYIYDLPIGQRASSLDDVLSFVKLAKEDGNPDMIKEAEEIMFMNMVFNLYLSAPAEQTTATMKDILDFIESSIFP